MATTFKLNKTKCLRCEHEWVPRVSEPRTCPKCKAAYWDVPRRKEKN